MDPQPQNGFNQGGGFGFPGGGFGFPGGGFGFPGGFQMNMEDFMGFQGHPGGGFHQGHPGGGFQQGRQGGQRRQKRARRSNQRRQQGYSFSYGGQGNHF